MRGSMFPSHDREEREKLLIEARRRRIPYTKIADAIGLKHSTFHQFINRKGGSKTEWLPRLDQWLRENIEPRMNAQAAYIAEGWKAADRAREEAANYGSVSSGAVSQHTNAILAPMAVMLAQQVMSVRESIGTESFDAKLDQLATTAQSIIDLADAHNAITGSITPKDRDWETAPEDTLP